MINKEKLKTTGKVNITVISSNGDIKDTRDIDNLVVTTGRNWIAYRLIGVPDVMSHMATGTDNTAQVLSDTTLGAEASRVALTSYIMNSNTVTYTAAFLPGDSTGAIVEAGIFNDATTGDMLCRTTFPVVNLAAADSMNITWTITIS
jgi:hypothetical protein